MPEPCYKGRVYATGHEAAWKIVNDFLMSILLIADHDRAELIAGKGYEIAEVKSAVGEGILAVCSWLSRVRPFDPHAYRSHMRRELQLLELLKGGDRAPPQGEEDGEEDKNCKGKQADDALPGMGQGDGDNPPDPGGSPDAANPFVRLLQEFRNAYLEFDGWTPPLLAYTYDERSRSKRIQSGRIEVLACVSWPRADATKDDYEFFVATESNDAVQPMRDRFKQLSTLAGASLPVVIRDSIGETVSPVAAPLNPLEWWIAFLWFHNPPDVERLDWADELTEGHWAIWDDPFLASIEAIERCGLHFGQIKFPAAAATLAEEEAKDRLKGVSLRDAATMVRPNDPNGQDALYDAWRKSRNPKLPKPIGKAPEHKQRNLYEPAALLKFLKEFEGPSVDRDFGLSSHFRKVSRLPLS